MREDWTPAHRLREPPPPGRTAACARTGPADLIVYKPLAWRPQDRDDITEVLAAGHDLNTRYVEYWAGEWDVLER